MLELFPTATPKSLNLITKLFGQHFHVYRNTGHLRTKFGYSHT